MFGFMAGFWLIGLLTTIFWVWMLIDCLQNPAIVGTEKIVWVLVIVLLHFLGALIYFFVAKTKAT